MTNQMRYWIGGIVGCVIASILIVLVIRHAENNEFRQALEWHRVHGDQISIGENKLSLPQDWWEKNQSDEGKQVLVKASRRLMPSVSSTAIVIERKSVSESKLDEDQISKHIQSYIEFANKGKQDPFYSMVTVKAASKNIYCRRTLDATQIIELRCDVVGAPIVISSVGPSNTESEIEAILATLN